jgi:nickel transport protein
MSVFKSLVNLAATAGVAGAIAVSPIFTLKAEAMTEAQALERLSRIPVFTITDDKGVPLTASVPQQPNAKPDDTQIWFFFLGADEAQMMLSQVQKFSPEIGKKAQITAASLTKVYEVIRQNQKDKKFIFEVIPAKSNFEAAQKILLAQGIAGDKTPNLPVFFLVDGDKKEPVILGNDTNKNGVIDKDEIQSLPFFFDRSDIQSFLDEQAKLQPDITKKTKVEVTSLFLVLENMLTKDNKPDPISDIIRFVPSRSSQEYILKNSKQATTPQAAPQATPAKK